MLTTDLAGRSHKEASDALSSAGSSETVVLLHAMVKTPPSPVLKSPSTCPAGPGELLGGSLASFGWLPNLLFVGARGPLQRRAGWGPRHDAWKIQNLAGLGVSATNGVAAPLPLGAGFPSFGRSLGARLGCPKRQCRDDRSAGHLCTLRSPSSAMLGGGGPFASPYLSCFAQLDPMPPWWVTASTAASNNVLARDGKDSSCQSEPRFG